MNLFFITAGIMGVLMAGMAVGVIFSNKPLKGSCGGIMNGGCACEEAGTPGACKVEEDVGAGEGFKPPGQLLKL